MFPVAAPPVPATVRAMYGMANKAIEQMICTRHGEAAWARIKAAAGVEVDVFIGNEPYDDAITYRLVAAASNLLQVPADVLLREFGHHWVLVTARQGYGALMQNTGHTLPEFLRNLDNLHTRVKLILPALIPPSFECHDITDSSMQVRYFSHRPGLAPFVVGLIEGLGEMFGTPATVEQVGWKDRGADHDAFLVRWPAGPAAV